MSISTTFCSLEVHKVTTIHLELCLWKTYRVWEGGERKYLDRNIHHKKYQLRIVLYDFVVCSFDSIIIGNGEFLEPLKAQTRHWRCLHLKAQPTDSLLLQRLGVGRRLLVRCTASSSSTNTTTCRFQWCHGSIKTTTTINNRRHPIHHTFFYPCQRWT